MNEMYLSDELKQKIEKLSNEIVSIIVQQVESAISNSEILRPKPKVKKFDAWTFSLMIEY